MRSVLHRGRAWGRSAIEATKACALCSNEGSPDNDARELAADIDAGARRRDARAPSAALH